MTRSSNYILMTFGLLDASKDIMAANGNHTISVVKGKGKEDYDVLKESFKDVLRDINEVVAEKKIEVDEGTVNLECFWAGIIKIHPVHDGPQRHQTIDVYGVPFTKMRGGTLLGTDKKKLLKELPEKLDAVIPDYENEVKLIWQTFSTVYAIVTCRDPSEEMVADYFLKAQEWVSLFHCMVRLLATNEQMHAMVKLFTGQGVEKNNDVARSIVLRKSNKCNGPADVLKHEARLWELKHRE
ncbi:Hypothetical predicted protein [Paramuricea clavata]|uniref:Uncharacterized protein n=1 Tax=Paramuricea clavata TaxID=317549 RepID=A0A7D9DMG7_PARCT|nr:Hypothetical predicted protein [Paramuricea clavata]